MLADNLAKFLKSLTLLFKGIMPDVLVVGGIVAVVYGVRLGYSIPAAWMTGGALAILLGVSSSKPK